MKLSRLFAAGVAALTIAGCSSGTDNQLAGTVSDIMVKENADIESFTVYTLTPETEVTLGQELDRRQKLFVTKEKTYRKKVEEYTAKGMKRNAEKNEAVRASAEQTIARLEAYKAEHIATLDSIVYTIFRLDGCGKTYEKQKIELRDYYVNVSPEGAVLAVQPSTGNPYQHMGTTIPGYKELVAGATE